MRHDTENTVAASVFARLERDVTPPHLRAGHRRRVLGLTPGLAADAYADIRWPRADRHRARVERLPLPAHLPFTGGPLGPRHRRGRGDFRQRGVPLGGQRALLAPGAARGLQRVAAQLVGRAGLSGRRSRRTMIRRGQVTVVGLRVRVCEPPLGRVCNAGIDAPGGYGVPLAQQTGS
jgi:hypothetical protein